MRPLLCTGYSVVKERRSQRFVPRDLREADLPGYVTRRCRALRHLLSESPVPAPPPESSPAVHPSQIGRGGQLSAPAGLSQDRVAHLWRRSRWHPFASRGPSPPRQEVAPCHSSETGVFSRWRTWLMFPSAGCVPLRGALQRVVRSPTGGCRAPTQQAFDTGRGQDRLRSESDRILRTL